MVKRWGVGSLGLIANWPKDQDEPVDNIVVLAADYDAMDNAATALGIHVPVLRGPYLKAGGCAARASGGMY